MDIVILFALLLILDVVAHRWGFDSRDGFHSREWEKLREWKAFH